MLRISRFGLIFVAFLAMTVLTISVRKRPASPASSTTRPIDEWDLSELAIHLNRKGVEVRLRSVPRTGPLTHSAYLTCTAKEWKELNLLNKDPQRIDEWQGTVYCERVSESHVIRLVEQWGERCLIVGPFIFYGDANLLQNVRVALAEFVAEAAS